MKHIKCNRIGGRIGGRVSVKTEKNWRKFSSRKGEIIF